MRNCGAALRGTVAATVREQWESGNQGIGESERINQIDPWDPCPWCPWCPWCIPCCVGHPICEQRTANSDSDSDSDSEDEEGSERAWWAGGLGLISEKGERGGRAVQNVVQMMGNHMSTAFL